MTTAEIQILAIALSAITQTQTRPALENQAVKEPSLVQSRKNLIMQKLLLCNRDHAQQTLSARILLRQ